MYCESLKADQPLPFSSSGFVASTPTTKLLSTFCLSQLHPETLAWMREVPGLINLTPLQDPEGP